MKLTEYQIICSNLFILATVKEEEDVMKKLFSVGLAVVMAVTLLAAPVLADKTMDQIEKSRKIKLGFREGSIPFAFIDPKVGKHVGFSVDMAGLLAEKSARERMLALVAVMPLLTIYAKGDRSTIPAHELRLIKETIDDD